METGQIGKYGAYVHPLVVQELGKGLDFVIILRHPMAVGYVMGIL